MQEYTEDTGEPIATEEEMVAAVHDSTQNIIWQGPDKVRVAAGIRRKRQVAFLKAYSECGLISKSCRAAGINMTTQRNWHCANDKWYRDHFKDAQQIFKDRVIEKVHNWALDGIETPIIGKVQTPLGPEDAIIGTKKIYSENMLMFLTKKLDSSFKDDGVSSDEDDKPVESISPITRITIQLDTMASRQQSIIDITPEKPVKLLKEDTNSDA